MVINPIEFACVFALLYSTTLLIVPTNITFFQHANCLVILLKLIEFFVFIKFFIFPHLKVLMIRTEKF